MRKLLIIPIAASILAACGPTGKGVADGPAIDSTGSYIKFADAKLADSTWSKDNIVVFHVTSQPDNLHPTNGISAEREFIFRYTQMTLLSNDLLNRGIRPQLVKSMPEISADGLRYTYELLDGITWDDGSPLTVNDVIFTFKANKCPLVDNPDARVYLEDLIDIIPDQVKPQRFTLVMKRKYMNNLSLASDFPIMQRSYFDKNNVLANYGFGQATGKKGNTDLTAWAKDFNDAKYGADPAFFNGLGAYKVTAWEPGISITLEKKKSHWVGKMEKPDMHDKGIAEKIIFKLNRDENSVKLEFKSQKFDGTNLISTRALKELQKDPNFNKNYHSYLVPAYGWAYLAFNMKPDGNKHKKLFTDKKVRRAIAMLIPVDDIIRTVRAGNGSRIATMVSPLKKSEVDSTLKPIDLNVEGAKKMLDEAGWKDTDGDNIRDKVVDGKKIQLEFDFNFPAGNPVVADMAKLMAEGMQKGGVKANMVGIEAPLIGKKASSHDFDMVFGQWGGNSQPEDYSQLWSTREWASGGSNLTGFGNAETDALIDSIRYATNDAARISFSKKLQKIVYDEQPYVFLYAPRRCVAIHKRFGNVVMVSENPNVMLNALQLIGSGMQKSEDVH
jgi:peptide/nickel transport system substrate-binding protein